MQSGKILHWLVTPEPKPIELWLFGPDRWFDWCLRSLLVAGIVALVFELGGMRLVHEADLDPTPEEVVSRLR